MSRPFGHVEKQLDKKAKVNFKTYDVTNWEINNYNIHIAQYPKVKGNKIKHEKYFSWKNLHKMCLGNYFKTLL